MVFDYKEDGIVIMDNDRKLNYKAFDKMEVSPQGRVVHLSGLAMCLGWCKNIKQQEMVVKLS